MSLKALPGPPPAFNSRDISDRYEPGTNATWIKNGVIFTGEKNGTVIIKGDLLLDKGIVRAIGRIPGWMLDQVDNLTTVNAHGAWITPGLGKASHQ
jgi:cytosine/adenosine deaminase-related metal-dependent hydrolase